LTDKSPRTSQEEKKQGNVEDIAAIHAQLKAPVPESPNAKRAGIKK
jgi:hypothetical protein